MVPQWPNDASRELNVSLITRLQKFTSYLWTWQVVLFFSTVSDNIKYSMKEKRSTFLFNFFFRVSLEAYRIHSNVSLFENRTSSSNDRAELAPRIWKISTLSQRKFSKRQLVCSLRENFNLAFPSVWTFVQSALAFATSVNKDACEKSEQPFRSNYAIVCL